MDSVLQGFCFGAVLGIVLVALYFLYLVTSVEANTQAVNSIYLKLTAAYSIEDLQKIETECSRLLKDECLSADLRLQLERARIIASANRERLSSISQSIKILCELIDKCPNCQGSGQDNDGETLISGTCPKCHELYSAIICLSHIR